MNWIAAWLAFDAIVFAALWLKPLIFRISIHKRRTRS
jgi:hypothetical protein